MAEEAHPRVPGGGAMNVYAIREPARQTVAVYVEVGEDTDGARWFHVQDPLEGPVRVVRGTEPPLWARVPMWIAEAIGEALAPRPEATERHLDDAIAIRDRLLSLVEKAHDGWKP